MIWWVCYDEWCYLFTRLRLRTGVPCWEDDGEPEERRPGERPPPCLRSRLRYFGGSSTLLPRSTLASSSHIFHNASLFQDVLVLSIVLHRSFKSLEKSLKFQLTVMHLKPFKSRLAKILATARTFCCFCCFLTFLAKYSSPRRGFFALFDFLDVF